MKPSTLRFRASLASLLLATACAHGGAVSNDRRDGSRADVVSALDAARPDDATSTTVDPTDDAATGSTDDDAGGSTSVGSCDETWQGATLGAEGCLCLPGDTAPCFVVGRAQRGVGVCTAGSTTCTGNGELGTWGPCVGAGSPSAEVCDGIDNDCDGSADPRCGCTLGDTRPCYPGPAATARVGACVPGRETCIADPDGAALWGDCTGYRTPGIELCDGTDRDCDGNVSNGCTCPVGTSESCYSGPDGTAGRGVCRAGTKRCVVVGRGGSAWLPCAGEVLPQSENCEGATDLNCDGHTGCDDPACATTLTCSPACMPGVNHYDLRPSADVLFLVDRSSSMSTAIPGGSTRWGAVRSAMHAVLPTLDTALNMGLVIFPEPDQCSVPAMPVVPISMPSSSTILAHIDASDPPAFAATPTFAALQSAERFLRASSSGRARYLVLATDGEPNCSGELADVLTELRALRTSLMIDTFVLGIPGDDSTLSDALNQMADAGGRPRAGAIRYYDASTAPALQASLRAITSTTSCVFGLGRSIVDPSRLSISVDGVTLSPSSTDGWDFTDPAMRTIRIHGPHCTMLNDGGTHSVRADLTC